MLSNAQVLFYTVLIVTCSDHSNAAAVAGGSGASSPDNGNFMDSLTTGFRLASKILGMNQSANVANLVAQAFSATTAATSSKPPPTDVTSSPPITSAAYADNDNLIVSSDKADIFQQTADPSLSFASGQNLSGLFGGLLRVLGMDETKLSAMVLNGLIFIAQMLQKLVVPKGVSLTPVVPEKDNYRKVGSHDDNILDWILTNPPARLQDLMAEARTKDLPERLATTIADKEVVSGETECIQLLLCKMAPVLWRMQQAIGDRIDGTAAKDNRSGPDDRDVMSYFTEHLPDADEFRVHGEGCENRYQGCELSRFKTHY